MTNFIEDAKSRHDDRAFVYTTCVNNGCWDASCILKCGVKNNKVVSIEVDDSINEGVAREDQDKVAIDEGMIQARACPMGHAWRQELEAKDRWLYPMKRVGEKGAGNGHFERISWEEALDAIADEIKRISLTYGEACIWSCMYSAFERTDFPLAPWIPGAIALWGDHSTSGGAQAEFFHLGYKLVDAMFKGTTDAFPGFEAPDLFNSNLIVLWGFDPLVSWFGATPYYMRLAKERGCKIIAIDPCYNVSCEVLADQWIPIRPGTDAAFALAVANVLYEEDLYDHDYVDKMVEPEGFETWRLYVTGKTDGEAKTPEWAEPICGIPAETIRSFARLYAESKPVHLQMMYSVSKRNLGDYAAAAAILLQAMTGNLSIPGGCQSASCTVTFPHVPKPQIDWGRAPADYPPPAVACNNNKMTEAMYCRTRFDAGEMSEEEFRRRVGCAEGMPLPNVKMAIIDNNYVNNQHDVTKRMEGFASLDFVWGWQWYKDQPSSEFMDIVLPAPIHQFESMDTYFFNQDRFFNSPGGINNYFMFCDKAVDPPGEVRPREWVWMELAKRLGVAEKYNPKMIDVSLEDWDEQVRERIYRPAYESWAKDENGELAKLGVKPLPWDEFLKKPVVRVPIDEPYYPMKAAIERGESPFQTPTGKVEFESLTAKSVDLAQSWFSGNYDPYPVWQPSYQDEPSNDSYYHSKTKEYPLSMITPVSTYRQHSSNDRNPWLKGDCYRHALWMSPADAQDRGIKDGDTVQAFNEYGTVECEAYVTSKIIPGTISLHHGEWYKPDTERTDDVMVYGIDTAGNCNMLIGDTHLPHILGALLTAGLVQVKKVGE